jgi:hypothetical protein
VVFVVVVVVVDVAEIDDADDYDNQHDFEPRAGRAQKLVPFPHAW